MLIFWHSPNLVVTSTSPLAAIVGEVVGGVVGGVVGVVLIILAIILWKCLPKCRQKNPKAQKPGVSTVSFSSCALSQPWSHAETTERIPPPGHRNVDDSAVR
jgi:hypothetical protein